MQTFEELQSLVRHAVSQDAAPKARFFKAMPGGYADHDLFLGVPNPALRTIAQTAKIVSLETIKQLLSSPYNEERFLALILLVNRFDKASQEEQQRLYTFYLEHTAHINNWNLVDASAHLIVGKYLFKRDKEILLTLAESHSLWERRIAIVATWYFIRKDELEWTFTLAKLLLKDKHDLIHKAAGWMLREAGKKNESDLKAFLDCYASTMPRTMLRYALEKFSPEEQKAYRQK